MIVMKFGGTSLASADSVRQVARIVQSEIHRHPVVVASAIGDTTDVLMEIARETQRAHTHAALKLQDQLKVDHFGICETLLHDHHREDIERLLQNRFRDLHVRLLEVCEGERVFTPEVQDWIVSLGEQLSSRLLAAALTEYVGLALHLDATKLILTDDNFTSAEPRLWETYARIRWSVPVAAQSQVVVLGGFIGSTTDGRVTTLGRGGSDLTASIVGAAINAEEIQVWKDVDGMLTCDPRVLAGGHQVRHLSYQEATELARAGATILHPKTMEPAKRLRIPIVIRNTFSPEGQGTRIESAREHTTNVVKSIAIEKACTVLEVRPAAPGGSCEALIALCDRFSAQANMLFSSKEVVYIALKKGAEIPSDGSPASACLKVRVRREQAIVTIVGENLDKQALLRRVTAALPHIPFLMLPSGPACAVKICVPELQLNACAVSLHCACFADPDPTVFITATARKKVRKVGAAVEQVNERSKWKRFAASTSLVHAN